MGKWAINAFITGLVVCTACDTGIAAITFEPGHFYATRNGNNFAIRQYDTNGVVQGFETAPRSPRGLVFGDDGLLYVVGVPDNAPLDGFYVNAIDASGTTVHRYTGSDYYNGNLTYGRIAIDDTYIYTAGQGHISRFRRDTPRAAPTFIYTGNQVHDVEVLPNGNLLVAQAYYVSEITRDGTYLKSIPYGDFSNIRAIEYDPATNSVFVSHFGTTASPNRLLKFDYTSGQLVDGSPAFAFDLFITAEGHLLMGSDAVNAGPRLFSTDLDLLSTFGGDYREFVTQMVPEPCSLVMLVSSVLFVRRSRRLG